MKQSSNGLVWGSILLGFGLLLLIKSLGWLHIEWSAILRFWPLLLVGAGLSLVARKTWSGAVAAILLAVAIPSAIVNGINHRWGGWRDGAEWNFDDNDRDDDDNQAEEDDRDYKDREESYAKDGDEGHFVEAFPKEGINEATLNFGGGAGEFKIEGTTDQLIDANTETEFGSYVLTTKSNEGSKSSVIDLKMEGKDNIKLKNFDSNNNNVDIKLNNQPLWSIDLGLGAGKGNFDLSDFKVKKVNIGAGAAEIDLKLGDKADLTEVVINAGVASITVEVPESAGCELSTNGAMNVRELDNFEKVKDGLYRTSNYDKATKKINIKYEGGLSRLEVNRY